MQINNGHESTLDKILVGTRVCLRPVTLNDCTREYVDWLNDPEVNKFLETRWCIQNIKSVENFVSSMMLSENNHLFAIIESISHRHIGNIKLGPINRNHHSADISYVIGNRNYWGTGCATDAVKLATDFAFRVLGVRRIRAGVYSSNVGSQRVLEKAGYIYETKFISCLKNDDCWDDHLWYVRFNNMERNER